MLENVITIKYKPLLISEFTSNIDKCFDHFEKRYSESDEEECLPDDISGPGILHKDKDNNIYVSRIPFGCLCDS